MLFETTNYIKAAIIYWKRRDFMNTLEQFRPKLLAAVVTIGLCAASFGALAVGPGSGGGGGRWWRR